MPLSGGKEATSGKWQQKSATAGGCDVPANPAFTSLERPVYWLLDTDPGIVHLVPTPDSGRSHRQASDFPVLHADADGFFGKIGSSSDTVSVAFPRDTPPNAPLAVMIPLDDHAFDRFDAALRLLRTLHERPTRDDRMTPDQRRRLQLILRAVDGRASGASLFTIAETLYERQLITSAAWDGSSARASVYRLIRDGRNMIEGGYRSLFRHRRRS